MYVYNAYSTLIYIHIIICMYIDIGISLDGGVVPAGDFANQSDSTKEWRVYQKMVGQGRFFVIRKAWNLLKQT